MSIQLATQPEELTADRLTPREIVRELDKYIVGQKAAKRAVAIALRNRWRRQQLAADLREEVAPKNIIMIGPTGVGKTEIARRLAKLTRSPFLKVEASKFTEVGYVGRDVESIVRDLTELGVKLVKEEKNRSVVEIVVYTALIVSAIVSIFFRFAGFAQLFLLAISLVLVSSSVSTIRSLFARREFPVSVMSTIASTKSGTLTSVAPHENSISIGIPFFSK